MQLVLTNKFKSTLKNIHPKDIGRIVKELPILQNEPLTGKPLKGSLKEYRSLRIGNYRVIYQIIGNDIVCHKVGPRQSIYD